MTQATVLIPTYDHGPLLVHALQSALAQTVQDIEIFIIGDGAPDVTRKIAAAAMARDSRVRFFDHPKGPRHGEVYRHQALAEAHGEIICYLSDDDLWLPCHVETMRRLLSEADFASVVPLEVETNGSLYPWAIDLQYQIFRDAMLAGGTNFVPLSCGAHTLASYRRLPHGWRTTPAGVWTDLYMWQQFLSQSGLRTISGTSPTMLHFPSSERRGWPIDRRLTEMKLWSEKLYEPRYVDRLRLEVLDYALRDRARLLEKQLNTRFNRIRLYLKRLPLVGSLSRFLGRAVTRRWPRFSLYHHQ